jgi:hypothetical protein
LVWLSVLPRNVQKFRSSTEQSKNQVFLSTSTFPSVTASVREVLVSKMFGPRLGLPVQWIVLSDSRWTLLTTYSTVLLVCSGKNTPILCTFRYGIARTGAAGPHLEHFRRVDNTNKMRRVLPIRTRLQCRYRPHSCARRACSLDSLNLNEPRHKRTPSTQTRR